MYRLEKRMYQRSTNARSRLRVGISAKMRCYVEGLDNYAKQIEIQCILSQ